jgi:hypothetical protein
MPQTTELPDSEPNRIQKTRWEESLYMRILFALRNISLAMLL